MKCRIVAGEQCGEQVNLKFQYINTVCPEYDILTPLSHNDH